MLFYVVWQAFYYVKVYKLGKRKVKELGYTTSLSYLTGPSQTGSRMFALIDAFGEPWRAEMFMAMQLVFTAGVVALASVFYAHFWAHTVFLSTLICWSAWCGGG